MQPTAAHIPTALAQPRTSPQPWHSRGASVQWWAQYGAPCDPARFARSRRARPPLFGLDRCGNSHRIGVDYRHGPALEELCLPITRYNSYMSCLERIIVNDATVTTPHRPVSISVESDRSTSALLARIRIQTSSAQRTGRSSRVQPTCVLCTANGKTAGPGRVRLAVRCARMPMPSSPLDAILRGSPLPSKPG